MNYSRLFLVNVPVANLRKEPVAHAGGYQEDPLQETQLLLGEPLLGAEAKNGWIYVHAPNQPYFSAKEGWSGYPGWVQESDVVEVPLVQSDTLVVAEHGVCLDGVELSIGTYLEHVEETESEFVVELPTGKMEKIEKQGCRLLSDPIDDIRSFIVDLSNSFLEMPYLWGGRSSYLPQSKQVTSVDCSGFIHLLYGMAGMILPRNAHDQYMRCLKMDPEEIQPGDLVFLAKKDKPERIFHVMLYQGNDMLIEASSDAGKVRQISVRDKIGASLQNIGQAELRYQVFFGSFLNENTE